MNCTTFTLILLLTLTTLSTQACGTAPTTTESSTPAHTSNVELDIHTYTSPGDGFTTNSFWVETTEGVIVFDAQFLPEYAQALLDEIKRTTNTPITDVIITHGNPDKYNGIGTFLSAFPHAVVWATPEINARIQEIDAGKRAYFAPQYEGRYVDELTLPSELITTTHRITRGGVDIDLIPLDAGVSTAHLVAHLPSSGDLFVGDLVNPEVHGWLAEGMSDEWAHRLDDLEDINARTIHGGRGTSMITELALSQQRNYLKGFQGCVAKVSTPTLDEATQASITQCVIMTFPEYAMEVMVGFSIPGEFARQHMQ